MRKQCVRKRDGGMKKTLHTFFTCALEEIDSQLSLVSIHRLRGWVYWVCTLLLQVDYFIILIVIIIR